MFVPLGLEIMIGIGKLSIILYQRSMRNPSDPIFGGIIPSAHADSGILNVPVHLPAKISKSISSIIPSTKMLLFSGLFNTGAQMGGLPFDAELVMATFFETASA